MSAQIKSRLAVLLSIFIVAGTNSAVAEVSQIETGNISKTQQSKYSTNIYGENYRIPTSTLKNTFLRARLSQSFAYFEVNYEKIDDVEFGNFEIGVQHFLSENTRLSLSLSRRGVGDDKVIATTEGRLGISTGYFSKIFHSDFFAETYGELFAIAPTTSSSYFTGSAWLKVGYRAYEKNHVIIDALIIELRTAQGTSISKAGPDYTTLNIGPRFSVWATDPTLSATVFIAKTQVLASEVDASDDEYWIICSFGGLF